MRHVREPHQRRGAQDGAGEQGVVSEQALDIETLKQAIAATGYTVTGAETRPYEKKGFFSFWKK